MGILGIFGQSDYEAKPYEVDANAFNDPNAAANKARIAAELARRRQQQAPTIAGATSTAASVGGPNLAQADQTRAIQMRGLSGLETAANGTAPSAAEIQGQKALADAVQAQRSSAVNMRGVSPALANHLAAQGAAAVQAGAVGDAAALRAQEQAAARGAFATALSQTRAQDLSGSQLQQNAALTNAGFQQQTVLANAANQQQAAMANQSATLQNQAQLDQLTQYYTQAGISIDQAQFMAQMELQRMKQQGQMGADQINAGVASGNAQNAAAITGGVISAAGSAGAAMLSDERTKEDVDREDTGKQVDSFLEALDSASWRYKDGFGEDSKRRRFGVMAQSLAKTEVGRAMVDEGEDGLLRVDTTRGFGAVLAAQRRLHDRIKDLESAKKGAAA